MNFWNLFFLFVKLKLEITKSFITNWEADLQFVLLTDSNIEAL